MSDKSKIFFTKITSSTNYKIFSSLVLAITAPYVLIVCAGLSAYFSNYKNLPFQLSNFLPAFALISLLLSAILFLLLFFTKNTLRSIIFTLCSYLVIAGFIQSVVTSLTFEGLPGDGTVSSPDNSTAMINLLIWLFGGLISLYCGVLWFRQYDAQRVTSFILAIILVLQTVILIPSAFSYFKNSSEVNSRYYLSEDGLNELSSDENIVILVVDNFDRDFFLELAKKSPESLEPFKDFTYYDDNISTYPRTYPAITSMLTGINTDFAISRKEYFETAYTTSPFIKDLIDNNYKINLYTNFYHAYEDADYLKDIFSNTADNGRYEIAAPETFMNQIGELSTYFWAPEIFKSQSISAKSFSTTVFLTGDNKGYDITDGLDPYIYDRLTEEGLNTENNANKTFTLLHLRGCYQPYTMDENCNEVAPNSVTALQQTKGTFRLVSEYINQMKELGIYDNSTIIITGDHSTTQYSNREYYDEALTALLVKQKNQKGTALTTSYAPVSQENLHAEIVKSAGLKTTHDYGTAYSDVPEDAVLTRVHYLQLSTGENRQDTNVTYEITGKGTDFSNWKITERKIIGSIYD